MDVVEYVPGIIFGIISYREGDDFTVANRIWLATLWSYEDVSGFIEWCDMECDREIYNRISKTDGDEDWL
jgi:hypothetical protein